MRSLFILDNRPFSANCAGFPAKSGPSGTPASRRKGRHFPSLRTVKTPMSAHRPRTLSAILACLVLALPAILGAAETAPLSWDDCAKAAYANNPALLGARFRLDAARARRNSVLGGFLPRVSAGMSADDSGLGAAPDVRDINLSPWSARVTVSQSLFSGFSTLSEAFRAAASVRQERARLRAESADARARLRSAFVGLLHAQENVGLLERIAKRRKDNAELVRLRYDAGREDKGSALRVGADAQAAAFDVARSRRALSLSRRRLAAETGLGDGLSELSVKGDWALPAPPISPDFARLVPAVPAAEQAAAALDSARASFAGSFSPFLPSADASAGISGNGPDWPPTDRGWSAGLSFSWNLFNGARDTSGAMAARADRRAAEENLDGTRRGTRVTLEDRWNAYADAYESVAIQKQYLEASTARSEIGRAQYANGLLSFTQWDLIESEMVNSERGYLNARREALLAESAWLNALGEGLEEKQ